MGDIILTTPVVRVLETAFPNAEIDFLTSSQFTEIYRYNPYLNNVIEYDKSKNIRENEKIKNILFNGKKYDLIVDLQNNLRSKNYSSELSDNILRIKKNRFHKLSLVYLKKPVLKNYSVVENYFNSIAEIGIKPDNKGLEIWTPQEKADGVYLKSINFKKTSIAIAPGANHFTKRWLPERFAELARKLKSELNVNIILLGGTQDKDLCRNINEMAGGNLEDCSDSTSILETTEQIDKCNLLITNDTGVMHIAASRQVPILAIFGSSVKELGFLPYKVPFKIIEKEMSCRPCSHIGRSSCPKKHFNCMKNIDVEDIFEYALKLIAT